MGGDDSGDDRHAEPGSAVGSVVARGPPTGEVGPAEALEHVGQQAFGKPVPVVGHDDLHTIAAEVGHGDAHSRAGMADGVADEVREHLFEAVPVGVHEHVRAVDQELGAGPAEPLDELVGQLPHVDRPQPQRCLVSVEAGEREEVFGEAAETPDLVVRPGQRVGHQVDRRRLRAGGRQVGEVELGQLQLAAQHPERCAQLVAGVVDEGSVGGHRLVHAVEQGVEVAGKGADLVVTARLRQPACRVVHAEPLGLAGHRRHRPQRRPHQQPGAEPGQRHERRDEHEQHEAFTVAHRVQRVRRRADDHDVIALPLGAKTHAPVVDHDGCAPGVPDLAGGQEGDLAGKDRALFELAVERHHLGERVGGDRLVGAGPDSGRDVREAVREVGVDRLVEAGRDVGRHEQRADDQQHGRGHHSRDREPGPQRSHGVSRNRYPTPRIVSRSDGSPGRSITSRTRLT